LGDAPAGGRAGGGGVGGVEPEQVGLPRQVRVEGRALDQRAHPGQGLRERQAEQRAVAVGGGDEAEQHPDRGGLARDVRPEEAVDGAARDDQVERVHGHLPAAEALGQPGRHDGGVGGGRGRPGGRPRFACGGRHWTPAAFVISSGVTAPTSSRPSSVSRMVRSFVLSSLPEPHSPLTGVAACSAVSSSVCASASPPRLGSFSWPVSSFSWARASAGSTATAVQPPPCTLAVSATCLAPSAWLVSTSDGPNAFSSTLAPAGGVKVKFSSAGGVKVSWVNPTW